MRVLVACEFSGIVRDAFAERGHDAWSCDLLDTERPGQHIKGDVLAWLDEGWDVMIAHPPCTYLSFAANRVWNSDGRWVHRWHAIQFFMELVHAPIDRICIENPLGVMNTAYRKPDQVIHPWMFGEPVTKRTCLWLKGLSPLVWDEATAVEPKSFKSPTGRTTSWHETVYRDGESERGKARSRTFPGIAQAMADQWGAA